MTDKFTQVVWNVEFDPFGNEVEQKGRAGSYTRSVTNNLRFPGQYYDAETGLNYNYFRDYNPVIGRYIEADPIGIKGGINLFSYVANNPILKIDIWGLEPNGCGPGDWRRMLVADNPLLVINFKSACNTHDSCYEKCGADKGKCDAEFKTDMKLLCYYKYVPVTVIDAPTLPNVMLTPCYGFANLYFNAVSQHGQSAFDNAQKNNKKCCKK